jgi:hypothetical protein
MAKCFIYTFKKSMAKCFIYTFKKSMAKCFIYTFLKSILYKNLLFLSTILL